MLKGMGQLGDMANLMKQAKEMQGKMTDAQAKLDEIEVTGDSGAGLVSATVTAKGMLRRLDIDPTILVASEKEVVEDLIVAAIKDAQEKAVVAAKEEMAKATEGLNLPAGMELPF
ncbi:MAG: YbaB/EbfC family nucleoid-associated protein [Amylibacter sp.]|jgi:DNA-binding YbaB/EbfC family protein